MDPQPQISEPILNVVGEKVALGPLRRDLLPLLQRWINDFEVTRTLASRLVPMTLEQEEAWYEGAGKSENDVRFILYQRDGMRPVGVAGLHHIEHNNRTAEFGVLIGEKDCWGKGYGTEATRLMLDYGFTCLGLHAIMLHVHVYNQRGISAYKRAGFKEMGRLRECHILGGKAYDVLIMDCLSTEFESPVLKKLLPQGGSPV